MDDEEATLLNSEELDAIVLHLMQPCNVNPETGRRRNTNGTEKELDEVKVEIAITQTSSPGYIFVMIVVRRRC